MVYDKKMIVKNIIQQIAERKGLSMKQWYKIEDWEIWDEVKAQKRDRMFTEKEIKILRLKLPAIYRKKSW